MVINIPIESLEERYSADWNKWFDNYVRLNTIKNVHTIYPDVLRDNIKAGDFLDITSTVYFKSKQIAEIAKRVDSGDIPRDEKVVFLIQDGWFPIEQLAYLRDMLGCHYWKFVGIFHAGTYSKWDLTARSHMYVWGEDLENSWFKIYDKIIVGSQHHKKLLLENRAIPEHKIEVIYWPVEVPALDITKKENIVVFPHRLGVEKQPHLFRELSQWYYEQELSDKAAHWRFVYTAEECKTKKEYYQLLAKSKIVVSLGLEELFGIAMVEATLLGCMPLVPDAFSYKEIFRRGYRYQDMLDFKRMLTFWMKGDLRNVSANILAVDFILSSSFYRTLFALIEEL